MLLKLIEKIARYLRHIEDRKSNRELFNAIKKSQEKFWELRSNRSSLCGYEHLLSWSEAEARKALEEKRVILLKRIKEIDNFLTSFSDEKVIEFRKQQEI